MAAVETDRLLNTLLDRLVSRMAGCGAEPMVLGLDDLEEATARALAVLGEAGLIEPADAARSIVCDGCDRACLMPVDIIGAAPGRPARAVIACDKSPDMGVVPVAFEALARWRCSMNGIAAVLARRLGTDRAPVKAVEGAFWRLGSLPTAGGGMLEVGFARRSPEMEVPTGAALPPVWIVLEEPADPAAGRGVLVSRVLVFRNLELTARREGLASLLIVESARSRIAVEVSYENREVVLIDRKSGARAALAKPRFGSVNDRVFTSLCRNSGRVWTRDALVTAAGIRNLTSLHKIAENLGFTGDLRRAFFQVSQQAILLQRTLTEDDLAGLKLDAGQLLAAARRRTRSARGRQRGKAG
jgi:hypothetical protein